MWLPGVERREGRTGSRMRGGPCPDSSTRFETTCQIANITFKSFTWGLVASAYPAAPKSVGGCRRGHAIPSFQRGRRWFWPLQPRINKLATCRGSATKAVAQPVAIWFLRVASSSPPTAPWASAGTGIAADLRLRFEACRGLRFRPTRGATLPGSSHLCSLAWRSAAPRLRNRGGTHRMGPAPRPLSRPTRSLARSSGCWTATRWTCWSRASLNRSACGWPQLTRPIGANRGGAGRGIGSPNSAGAVR